MTAAFFFAEPSRLANAAPGAVVTIEGDEGRHAVTVKRITVGEQVLVGDGKGRVVCAVVSQLVGKDVLHAVVESVEDVAKPTPTITVAQALIKGDRMDRAIETMTEAGVDRLVLWQAQRSIARVNGSNAARLLGKARTRAEQAAKQARRAYVPEVDLALGMAGLVECAGDSTIYVLDESATTSLADVIRPMTDQSSAPASARNICLVVGPEGGVHPDELAQLLAVGGSSVRIGASVLRASTAGTVALGWVMGATGRWEVADGR